MLKIVCISDTHSYHRKINVPKGDVLISAGDITWRGEVDILEDFAMWMAGQPHKYKISILGNHDKFEYRNQDVPPKIFQKYGINFLHNSGIDIDGIYFWGSPVSPFFHNWAWNVHRGKDIAKVWSQIPDNTNILITHGPAYGKLDRVEKVYAHDNVGCKDLLLRIKELKSLKASIAGHLHLQGGNMLEINGVKYVNAACCDEAYNPIQPPVVFEI